MGWSTGTFTLTTSGLPYVTGTTISSTVGNNLNTELQTGINQCINKDGSNAVTGNLNLATYRITALGAATAVTDAARASQVQNNSFITLSTVAGSNTVTGAATPTPAAYAEGQKFQWIPAATNTGEATLNVSSLGALPIFWNGTTATASTLIIGIPVAAEYISTSSATGFHILEHSGFLPRSLLSTYAITPSQITARGQMYVGTTSNAVTALAAAASDGMYLMSTASNSNGVAWKTFQATQVQMEAGTAQDAAVTPNNFSFHPLSPKGWVVFDASASATIVSSFNVNGVSGTAGEYVVSISSAMSSSTFPVFISCTGISGGNVPIGVVKSTDLPTTSKITIQTVQFGVGPVASKYVYVMFMGDLP